MKSKDPIYPPRVVEKLERMVSGKYVARKELDLDEESQKIFDENMAKFAREQLDELKRQRSEKQPVEVSDEEVSDSEPQDSAAEDVETDEEVDGSEHESESEKEAEEQVETAVEAVEQETTIAPWRVISPVGTHIPSFEELEQTNREHREAEEEEIAEREALRKKKGKAIATQAKRARELTADPDFQVEAETIETGETSAPKKKGKKAEDVEFTFEEYYRAFLDTGFAPATYPHEMTMKKLGIYKDVDDILSTISMDQFVDKAFPTYPKLAAEFLSTLTVHDMQEEILQAKFGGGMITFRAWGRGESLNFNEIDAYFGFKDGRPKPQDINKKDQAKIWTLIAGLSGQPGSGKVPRQPKGSAIRNPGINYARRVIAETFYSRYDTHTVSSQDLQMMTASLSKLFVFEEPPSGDMANAGLTFLLCKHLESFKSKVQTITRKKQRMAKMTIGGTITGLLTLAKVDLTGDTGEEIPPRYMDSPYLRDHHFLTGPRQKGKYYYQFQTPSNPSAIIRLPNTEVTDLAEVENIIFIPPQDLLIDLQSLLPPPETTPASKAGEAGPSKKRKTLTAAPSGRRSVARTCACMQDGYRESLIAEIQASLQEQVQRQIAEGIAELSRGFARLTDLPGASRETSVQETPMEQLAERPTVGSTSGSMVQTRVISADEDTSDIAPEQRTTIIRIKTKKPAPKRA